jgi:hypothetical protein
VLVYNVRGLFDVGIENTGIEKKTKEWGKCVVVKQRKGKNT